MHTPHATRGALIYSLAFTNLAIRPFAVWAFHLNFRTTPQVCFYLFIRISRNLSYWITYYRLVSCFCTTCQRTVFCFASPVQWTCKCLVICFYKMK